MSRVRRSTVGARSLFYYLPLVGGAMSYEVLARKWRPLTFDDVVGQDHITRTLKKAVETDRELWSGNLLRVLDQVQAVAAELQGVA